MPATLAQKLKIKEQFTLLTLHAPGYFKEHLQPLPAGVKIVEKAAIYQQVHWFVFNKGQLEKEVDKVLQLVKDDIVCWTYYPKGTSDIQTDLTRDRGWDGLLKHNELQWISLIAFDNTWSAFGFRMKTKADKRKEQKPKVREIFKHVNPEKKEVYLPDDISIALEKNKPAATFFNSLSFSNKKEYIEWIVTAKRDETRKKRIEITVEKLTKGWKNPSNI
jgi:hypothetical protein